MLARLYHVEKQAASMTDKQRYYYRRHYAKSWLRQFGRWIQTIAPTAPKKSPLANALNYILNHWQALNNYLRDGVLSIENNAAERAMRPVVLGRKNYLFTSSPVIFKDISFSVKAGEFVAIVGPSGSGKTSLYRLLLGFEEPDSGMVLYDDCDLANLNHASVRRQLGVVIQDSALTPGTVLQHIVGQHTHVSEDEVWQVLENVALREDIEAMPMGLQTLLAEGGKTLSVGQRQRLSIAKALIHQPKIVFLDEATSALDNMTQTTVYKNIAKLNITRIVAAHRLSTIQAADNIIVINDGHIVQQGKFDALAQQQGLFATMLERQTF